MPGSNNNLINKIRAASDLERVQYHVAEWDVDIEIRSLSAKQRATLQTLIADDTDGLTTKQEVMWTFLMVNCCYDPETGEPVFTDEDMDWVLTEKAFKAIDKVTTRCLQVSGVLKGSTDELGKSSLDSPTSTG